MNRQTLSILVSGVLSFACLPASGQITSPKYGSMSMNRYEGIGSVVPLPSALCADGRIVGSTRAFDGTLEGRIWDAITGEVVALTMPSVVRFDPCGILPNGDVFGTVRPQVGAGPANEAMATYDLATGVVTLIPLDPSIVRSEGVDVNAQGRAVGTGWDSFDVPAPICYDVVADTVCTMPGVVSGEGRAINDNNVITGYEILPGGTRGFITDGVTTTFLDPLPGGNVAQPIDINNAGIAVGFSTVPGGGIQPVRWRNGETEPLSFTGGDNGVGISINTRGDIVGWIEDALGVVRGALWRNGVLHTSDDLVVNLLSSTDVEFHFINDAGLITGYADLGLGIVRGLFVQPFPTLEMTGVIGVPGDFSSQPVPVAMAANGDGAGFADVSGEMHAVAMVDGITTDLGTQPGHLFSAAFDVNSQNLAVGVSVKSGGAEDGVIWNLTTGAITSLNNATVNIPIAVNSSGLIVGQIFNDTTGSRRAFARVGGVVTPLLNLPGAVKSIAVDVNDNDDILGVTEFADGSQTLTMWLNGPTPSISVEPTGFPNPATPPDLQYPMNDPVSSFEELAVLPNPQPPSQRVSNDRNVAYSAVVGGNVRAFSAVWVEDDKEWFVRDLGTLGGPNSAAMDNATVATNFEVQDLMSIVGWAQTPVSATPVAIISINGVTVNANALLETSPPARSAGVSIMLQSLNAINGDGSILGTALVDGQPATVALEPVDFCPADTDNTGDVGIEDFLAVLAQWGPCSTPCSADTDASGDVGIDDFLAVLANWGPCP